MRVDRQLDEPRANMPGTESGYWAQLRRRVFTEFTAFGIRRSFSAQRRCNARK
jgi:hypothetical protein